MVPIGSGALIPVPFQANEPMATNQSSIIMFIGFGRCQCSSGFIGFTFIQVAKSKWTVTGNWEKAWLPAIFQAVVPVLKLPVSPWHHS
jgi:hypothetical protein